MSAYGDRRVSHSGLIPFLTALVALSLPTTRHGRCRTGRHCFQRGSPRVPVLGERICLFVTLNAADRVVGPWQQFTSDFIHFNPGIFVGLDWVHPAWLREFLHDCGMLSTLSRRDPVKSEASEPSLRIHSNQSLVLTRMSSIFAHLRDPRQKYVSLSQPIPLNCPRMTRSRWKRH